MKHDNDIEILQTSNFVCQHLLTSPDQENEELYQAFTGKGMDYNVICNKCYENPQNYQTDLEEVTIDVYRKFYSTDPFIFYGRIGMPEQRQGEFVELKSQLIEHNLDLERLEIVSITKDYSTGNFILLFQDKLYTRLDFSNYKIFAFDTDTATFKLLYEISDQNIGLFSSIDFKQPVSVILATEPKLLGIANMYRSYAVVMFYDKEEIIAEIDRGSYHNEHSVFPFELFCLNDEWYIIHGSDWNKVDIFSVSQRAIVTERDASEYDYFQAELGISPNSTWVVDSGWIWSPLAVMTYWKIEDWFSNPAEPESDATLENAYTRTDWNLPFTWYSDDILLVGDYIRFDESIECLISYDLEKNEALGWFIGPSGALEFDQKSGLLLDFDKDSFRLWNVTSGEKVYDQVGEHIIGISNGLILSQKDNSFMIHKIIG